MLLSASISKSASIALEHFYGIKPEDYAPEEPQEEPQEEALMEKAEQERFSRLRRLNALRLEKEQAIRSEDYERAAQLRDEIRKLEDMWETA